MLSKYETSTHTKMWIFYNDMYVFPLAAQCLLPNYMPMNNKWCFSLSNGKTHIVEEEDDRENSSLLYFGGQYKAVYSIEGLGKSSDGLAMCGT